MKTEVHALGWLFVPSSMFWPEGQLLFAWETIFPISACLWGAQKCSALQSGCQQIHPCQSGCTLGQTAVCLHIRTITPGRSLASPWLSTSPTPMKMQPGLGKSSEFTQRKEKYALSHGDGGLCELIHSLCSEVSGGSADPGTASLATGTKVGHSSPSHSSIQHSCLVIWLGESQIPSELSEDTHC